MSKLILTAVVIALCLPSAALARDAFAGTWEVVVTPGEDAAQAKEKEFKDTFTFKGNQFTSAAFAKKGFEPVEYEENQQYGLAATFKAEGKSEKNGTATWSGQASASQMKGELIWTRGDGKELSYTFQATRKQ